MLAGYNRFLADWVKRRHRCPRPAGTSPGCNPLALRPSHRRMAEVVAVRAGIAALADGMLGAQPPGPPGGKDGAGTRCQT